MSRVQTSNFVSGMTPSFSQAVKPPAQTAAPATKPQTPSLAQTAGNMFSAPAAASQGTVTTSSAAQPNGAQQKPLAASSGPAIPSVFGQGGLAQQGVGWLQKGIQGFGTAVTAGKEMPNWGAFSGVKEMLNNPQAFGGLLSSLAPIAGPLLQMGGMPLLMAAYGAIRDPAYLKGMMPSLTKLGVAIPPPAPAELPPFDWSQIQPPSILGSGVARNVIPEGAHFLPRMMEGTTVQRNVSSMPAGEMARGLGQIGLGIGGLAVGNRIPYQPPSKPGLTRSIRGALPVQIPFDAASMALDPRSVRQQATGHLEQLHPTTWAKGYGDILNDPSTGVLGKGFELATHTALGNPVSNAAFSPVRNVAAIGAGLDDLTGASNAAWRMSGGRMGAAPWGSRLGIPESLSILFGQRQAQGKRPRF